MKIIQIKVSNAFNIKKVSSITKTYKNVFHKGIILNKIKGKNAYMKVLVEIIDIHASDIYHVSVHYINPACVFYTARVVDCQVS